ncbi:MAG: hypothetical protein GX557_05990, partial [Chloroflexi bacterium]|nr:hypothetical protein [Chloroflexota bacterium]
TPTGQANLATIERRIAAFYAAHQQRISGLIVFRYWKDSNGSAPVEDYASIPNHHYGEMIRLRFRVADADEPWARAAFFERVIAPLQVRAEDTASACLAGWRRFEGYSARGDLGARYGDIENGVDPTEQIVSILTAWTCYRFFLLDHPDLVPNHDLINLCFNTLGLTYPEEVEVLEDQQANLRRLISRAIGF